MPGALNTPIPYRLRVHMFACASTCDDDVIAIPQPCSLSVHTLSVTTTSHAWVTLIPWWSTPERHTFPDTLARWGCVFVCSVAMVGSSVMPPDLLRSQTLFVIVKSLFGS